MKMFLDPVPPTHNPLIGAMPIDTLNNIHASLVSLRDLYVIPSDQPVSMSGFYYFMCAIVDALEFETKHRLNQRSD